MLLCNGWKELRCQVEQRKEENSKFGEISDISLCSAHLPSAIDIAFLFDYGFSKLDLAKITPLAAFSDIPYLPSLIDYFCATFMYVFVNSSESPISDHSFIHSSAKSLVNRLLLFLFTFKCLQIICPVEK